MVWRQKMLVLDTFFKSGVFVPNEPIANFKEGQKVRITIEEETEKERRIRLWDESLKLLDESSDEMLPDDFPVGLQFRTPEEIGL
jgi:predicted DNA-binding antitoxin AbrB/MazE fold protein